MTTVSREMVIDLGAFDYAGSAAMLKALGEQAEHLIRSVMSKGSIAGVLTLRATITPSEEMRMYGYMPYEKEAAVLMAKIVEEEKRLVKDYMTWGPSPMALSPISVRVYHANDPDDPGQCGHIIELGEDKSPVLRAHPFKINDDHSKKKWAEDLAREWIQKRWPTYMGRADWSNIDVQEVYDR